MSATITPGDKEKQGKAKRVKVFGAKFDDLSPAERAQAITGYDLRARIEALIAGVTGKTIKVAFFGDGACTNETVMILPSIPQTHLFLRKDALTLLGYAAHEISHQLETDFEILRQIFADPDNPTREEMQLKEWWNAIEDYRIEKLTRREFPGFPIYIGVTRDYTAQRFIDGVSAGKFPAGILSNPYRIGAVGLTWVGAILNGYPTQANDEALKLLDDGLEMWLRSQAPRLANVESRTDALQLAKDLLDELKQAQNSADQKQSQQGDNGQQDQSGQGNQNDQSGSQMDTNGSGGQTSDAQEDAGDASDQAAGGQNGNESSANEPAEDSSNDGSHSSSQSDPDVAGNNDADSAEGDSDTASAEEQASGEEESTDNAAGDAESEEDADGDSENDGQAGGDADENANESESNEGQNGADAKSEASDGQRADHGSDDLNAADDKANTDGECPVGDQSENKSAPDTTDNASSNESSAQSQSQADLAPGAGADQSSAGDSDGDQGGEDSSSANSNSPSTQSMGQPGGEQAPAPKTAPGEEDVDAEQSDLNIDDIIEVISSLSSHLDNAQTQIESDVTGGEREVVQRAQKKYAALKRQVGSPSARSAGIVRRLLTSQNNTRTRRNLEQGRLDLKRLVPIVNGSTSVYYEKSTRKDVNSAVSILVDNSISMNGYPIEICQKAAIVLDAAISGTGTDLEITGFTGSAINPIIYEYRRFGQRGQAAAASLGSMDEVGMGGTPVGVPILESHRRLMAHKAPRKIMIIISDGQASDAQQAREAHDVAVMTGCLVFGIGIGQAGSAIAQWCDNCQVILEIDDLPVALSNIVHEALRSQARKAA